MKILVAVSKTPDTTAKIGFTDNNTRFDTNGVQFIMNPYDEWYALVRALEIKEAQGGSVTVISIGEADGDQVIRKALAIGADDAIRVDSSPLDAFFVANEIAHNAQSGQYDMVFLGKESIDYNGSEVGAMVAEILGWPFISYANKLDLDGTKATVNREVEGGVETVETSVPFVLSAAKDLAEQRIPNMRGIMMAKTKPLNVVAPTGEKARTTIAKYAMPKEKSAVKLVDADNMDELVRLLKEDAKIL
jgi:electron transfer flavoprotein beta subunit